MATRKPATKGMQTSAKRTSFSDEERAAMKERAQELKAEARANRNRADGVFRHGLHPWCPEIF